MGTNEFYWRTKMKLTAYKFFTPRSNFLKVVIIRLVFAEPIEDKLN